MSKWLARAKPENLSLSAVPNSPKSPKLKDGTYFGDFGYFGTPLREIGSEARDPVSLSPEDWDALFDERAGIREFDGGMPRSEAEALALQDTIAVLGPGPITRRACA